MYSCSCDKLRADFVCSLSTHVMTNVERFIELRPECIHTGAVRLLVNDGIHSFSPEYDLSAESIVINNTKMYLGIKSCVLPLGFYVVSLGIFFTRDICFCIIKFMLVVYVYKRSSHLNQNIIVTTFVHNRS